MTLAFLALAWLIGIFIADWFILPVDQYAGLVCIGIGTAMLGRRIQPVRLFGLCLICLAAGGLRHNAAQVETNPESVWLLADQGTVYVEGFVAEAPRRTDNRQQLIIESEAAQLEARTGLVVGRLLINLPLYPEYHYGQRLLLRGQIELPRTANRPNAFNYRAYLARQQIFALMDEPEVRLLPGEAGNPIIRSLLAFRRFCHDLLLRAMPEPQASMAAGMLLGLKAGIPDPVYDAFRVTGSAHILVISGWHLSLVAALVIGSNLGLVTAQGITALRQGGLARALGLGRWQTFWLALGVVWLYTLLVGATPSVLRSAVMASLLVLALSVGRQFNAWVGLMVACFALTTLDPNTLWDIGFQLSVLATAGLLAFSFPIRQLLDRVSLFERLRLGWVADLLAATLAAQLLTLPITSYHFGVVSLIAPFANLVLVPLVPLAMGLGGALLLLNLFALPLLLLPLLGEIVTWLIQGCWLLAWMPFLALTNAAQWLAALPWAEVSLPPVPLWLVLGYYGAIGGGWWLHQRFAPPDDEATLDAVPNPNHLTTDK